MIDDALEYIRKEIREDLNLADQEVMIDNLHVLKDETNAEAAYVSLVNLQEEAALKNTEHFVRQNGKVHYKEPPVHLNLYVLLAFEFDSYETSLLRLSQTIELFQNKRHFSGANERPGNPFPAALDKLVFDFHNVDFEQLNHLWGVLGGAYFPSVLYKVRLVQVQRDETLVGPEILTVEVESTLR